MSTSAPRFQPDFHPDLAQQSLSTRDASLPGMANADSWKQELNARLRDHRQRRAESARASSAASGSKIQVSGSSDGSEIASRVAARVAARYSNAPSYQDLLAASALAAANAAETAAEAALEAHAAAQAVLSEWTRQPQNESPAASSVESSADQPGDPFADPFFTDAAAEASPRSSHVSAAGLATHAAPLFEPAHERNAASLPLSITVEHHEPLPPRTPVPTRHPVHPVVERARSFVDAFAEAVVPAAQSLPAKLIEFPRELIAPRKQRPRLAEGPLFEEASNSMALRIFEVENAGHATHSASAATIDGEQGMASLRQYPASLDNGGSLTMATHDNPDESPNEYQHDGRDLPRRRGGFQLETNHAPNVSPGTARSRPVKPVRPEPGWGSIRLGEHPSSTPEPEPSSAPEAKTGRPTARLPEHGYPAETAPPLHGLAPIADRFMSALIDGGIVLACFLVAVLVFVACTTQPPTGKGALVFALLALGILATFYGWLFMSYGGGSTPGMRYARIALCSFADDNPTRKELQNRIPATALALLPLGLGLFWALLDEEKLGWHDRMTRTYQRSYR